MQKLGTPHARILFAISDLAKKEKISGEQRSELKCKNPMFQTVMSAGEMEGEGVLEAIQIEILKVIQHQAPYAHELEGTQENEIDQIVNRFDMGPEISKEDQDPFDSPEDERLMKKKRKANKAMKEELKQMAMNEHVANIKDCSEGPSPVTSKKTIKEMLEDDPVAKPPVTRSPLGTAVKKFEKP